MPRSSLAPLGCHQAVYLAVISAVIKLSFERLLAYFRRVFTPPISHQDISLAIVYVNFK